ncbi:MAG: hypothetical protein V1776_02835 [Candidatus Diapherotrites archaeon]
MVSQWELPVEGNPSSESKEWVLMQPQKCVEIPWRSEWAQQHQASYSTFPVQEEIIILTSYYTVRGVPIEEVQLTYQATDSTCTQCGCLEPFVFALYVRTEDAARLAVSGFTILNADDPTVFTGLYYRQSPGQNIKLVKESECEGLFATQTLLDGLFGNKKDSCYIQAAISEGNPVICQNVFAVKAKETCYQEVAVSLKSVDICNRIASQGGINSCIGSVAGVTHNVALCNMITDSTAKYFCELGASPK